MRPDMCDSSLNLRLSSSCCDPLALATPKHYLYPLHLDVHPTLNLAVKLTGNSSHAALRAAVDLVKLALDAAGTGGKTQCGSGKSAKCCTSGQCITPGGCGRNEAPASCCDGAMFTEQGFGTRLNGLA